MPKCYYVYMLTNKLNKVLYVGVTNNLERRIFEHQSKTFDGFTKRYNLVKLVHYEETNDILIALNREKEIKGWLREKKLALIEATNLEWRDLSEEF